MQGVAQTTLPFPLPPYSDCCILSTFSQLAFSVEEETHTVQYDNADGEVFYFCLKRPDGLCNLARQKRYCTLDGASSEVPTPIFKSRC